MRHPIQPLEKDSHGTLRFKKNAIVDHLYEWAKERGMGLNEIACLPFSKEDRQQFAQLLGYSLDGYSELTSYVDADAFGVAVEKMAENTSDEEARIRHLEGELHAIRSSLREPIARLFGVHPDDLKGA
jgi:hypothetical protein